MPCSFGILVLQPGTETRTEPGPLPSAMKAQSPNHWTAKDTTEWLHFDFSLSCIGEGNGNPLQCSCLENPTRTGEPDGLPSMGLHRVGHDWSNLAVAAGGGSDSKVSACNAGDLGLVPGSGRSPGWRKWQPIPVLLPGKFLGWRNLVDQSPWDRRVGHDWAVSLVHGDFTIIFRIFFYSIC